MISRLIGRRSVLQVLQRPRQPSTLRWQSRTATVLVCGGLIGGAGYYYDREYQAGAIRRSIRALWTGLVLSLDCTYRVQLSASLADVVADKINFTEKNVDGIDELHRRNAARVFECIEKNAGLYIKAGQVIAMQSAVLPAAYQDQFANIFDHAPTVPFSEVQQTIRAEFGKDISELFDEFDPHPVASASIAQVHRAKLNGRDVAVKVQKQAIAQHLSWDLWCQTLIMRVAGWWHEIPVAFTTDYIQQQVTHETDFLREARNATRAAEDIQSDSWLRSRVYVPKVYWERTTKQVMTAEWIDGASRLNDKTSLARQGFDMEEVMNTVISALSAQMFVFGFLHCDPHPGNILVRPHPQNPRRPQTVLIDFGLCIELRPEFRQQYVELWRALFQGDLESIERTAQQWGFDASSGNILASVVLLKPTRFRRKKEAEGKNPTASEIGPPPTPLTEEERKKRKFERQTAMKARMKSFLQNEELVPLELMFIGRVQRMLQASNQLLGSPSNRVNILAKWAISYRSTVPPFSSVFEIGPRPLLTALFSLFIFRSGLLVVDIMFRWTRIKQWWRNRLTRQGTGFEDVLEQQVREMIKDQFGVELHQNAFAG